MRAISLRPKAQQDLERIGDYTFEQWGEREEEIYLGMINQAFASLIKDPEKGRAANDLAPGLRKLRVGRHMIFYLSSEVEIDVVRILHQSMDFRSSSVSSSLRYSDTRISVATSFRKRSTLTNANHENSNLYVHPYSRRPDSFLGYRSGSE